MSISLLKDKFKNKGVSRVIFKPELEKMLPHRGNALKIDSVLYFNPIAPELNHKVMGFKEVKKNDPDLAGHFPGKPIYPGHCQIECVCLSAAVLIMSHPEIKITGLPFFRGLGDTTFRLPINPGELLGIHVELTAVKKNTLFIFDGKIVNDKGETVMTTKNLRGVAR